MRLKTVVSFSNRASSDPPSKGGKALRPPSRNENDVCSGGPVAVHQGEVFQAFTEHVRTRRWPCDPFGSRERCLKMTGDSRLCTLFRKAYGEPDLSTPRIRHEGRRKVRGGHGGREGQGELRRSRRPPSEDHPFRQSAKGNHRFRLPRTPEDPALHLGRHLPGRRSRTCPRLVVGAPRDATRPHF